MNAWLGWIQVLCLGSLLGASAGAEEPRDLFERAALAYGEGAYSKAAELLSGVPELLGVVPLLDRPQAGKRARIFFDLGRSFLAAGDSVRARVILEHVFALDPEVRQGVLPLAEDRALKWTRNYLVRLRLQKQQAEFAMTSSLRAAGRSLLLPGWGQIYRGRKKRGVILMGTSAALMAVWLVTDRSYRDAYDVYRSTTLRDLKIFERKGSGGDPLPFETRYERARSRAKTANIALGVLAAVWIGSVMDNLFIGPGRVAVEFRLM